MLDHKICYKCVLRYGSSSGPDCAATIADNYVVTYCEAVRGPIGLDVDVPRKCVFRKQQRRSTWEHRDKKFKPQISFDLCARCIRERFSIASHVTERCLERWMKCRIVKCPERFRVGHPCGRRMEYSVSWCIPPPGSCRYILEHTMRIQKEDDSDDEGSGSI